MWSEQCDDTEEQKHTDTIKVKQYQMKRECNITERKNEKSMNEKKKRKK